MLIEGELRCIRATTTEYRNHVEKDPFERRFQQVFVNQPMLKTRYLTKSLKEKYETHRYYVCGFILSKQLLSDRYIMQKFA